MIAMFIAGAAIGVLSTAYVLAGFVIDRDRRIVALTKELDDAYQQVFELVGEKATGRRWAQACEAQRKN